MGNNYEEPASLRVDSVIAVSKDTRWSTLQRQKPGSRKGQIKMQGHSMFGSGLGTKTKKSVKGAPLRSKSVQDMNQSPPSYESVVGNRKLSTPVAVAMPQVPHGMNFRRSSHGTESLTRQSLSSKSTPNLDFDDSPLDRINASTNRPVSCAMPNNVRLSQQGLQNGSVNEAAPVEATVVAVEESRPTAQVTIVATPIVEHSSGAALVRRSNSQPCVKTETGNDGVFMTPQEMLKPRRKAEPVSLSDALQEAVAARSARINRKSSVPEVAEKPQLAARKSSAPAQLQFRKKLEPAEKVKSLIMEQLQDNFILVESSATNSEAGTNGGPEHAQFLHSHVPSRLNEESGRQTSSTAAAHSVAAGEVEQNTTARHPGVASSADIYRRYTTPTSPTNDSNGQFTYDNREKPEVTLTRKPSWKQKLRARTNSKNLDPNLSAHANSNKAPTGKPPMPPRPPSLSSAPASLKNVPLTAVRAGLITADALSAKKNKLKAVTENSKAPVPSKATRSQTNGPQCIGNQHANLLAKAVAARAVRMAEHPGPGSESESKDDEWTGETRHSVPVCRANDTNNNQGNVGASRRSSAQSPVKPSPPVAPKKKRIAASKVIRPQQTEPKAQRATTLTATKHPVNGSHNPVGGHASRTPPCDIPAPLLSEEDRTMMLLDEVIRCEAESENWSLNSWTGSDSSNEVAVPLVANEQVDGRSRPVRLSSESRPNEQRPVRLSSESRSSEQRPIRLSSESQPCEQGLVRLSSESSSSEQRPVRLSSENQPYEQGPVRLSSKIQPYEQRTVRHSSESYSKEQRSVRLSSENPSEERPVRRSSEDDEVLNQGRPAGVPSESVTAARPWYECSSLSEEEPPLNPTVGSFDKLITTKKGIQIKLHFEKKSSPTSSPPPIDYNAIDNVVPLSPRLAGRQADTKTPPQSPHNKPGLKETHFGSDNFTIPPPPMAFEDEGEYEFVVSPTLPPPPEFSPVVTQDSSDSGRFDLSDAEDLRESEQETESPRKTEGEEGEGEEEEASAELVSRKDEVRNEGISDVTRACVRVCARVSVCVFCLLARVFLGLFLNITHFCFCFCFWIVRLYCDCP